MSGVLRIIPARAGFTGLSNLMRPCRKDHPRSRGVYCAQYVIAVISIGSSPLARGLRMSRASWVLALRIIPARAGFTVKSISTRTCFSDHPRSRGVYRRRMSGWRASPGSSPLARGLPFRFRGWTHMMGIIPARAGFTHLYSHNIVLPEDHPRSRGVYPGRHRFRRHRQGSSPLARGLHNPGTEMVPGLWIIPARAGFTLCWPYVILGMMDHPRSRGVYAATPRMAARMVGSSPLARGLLVSTALVA